MVIYVELGGCDRVFRYESGAGGLMGLAAGQATPGSGGWSIEKLTHSRSAPAEARSIRPHGGTRGYLDWGGVTPWHAVDHEAL